MPIREVFPRLGARAGSAVGVLLLALAAPLAAQQGTPGQRTGRALGTVTDRSNGTPVRDADVTLARSGTDAPVVSSQTDSAGFFVLDPVPPGTYTLVIGRIGYRPITYPITLGKGSDLEVRVALVPQALTLDPVVVTIRRRVSAEMQGFEARRVKGIGTFITREQIEQRRPAQVTDIFRTVPGVRIRPVNATGRSMLTMRGGCQPQMIIDGLPVASGYVSPDLTLRPQDIEAIEVYDAGTTPPQYGPTECGTIVFWTRKPRRSTSRGTPWKLLGGLAAVVAVMMTVFR